MCTMGKCSGSKILMNGEIDSFYFKELGLYFVNRCEAMFSTERLKISKRTWNKCLLETNFASSVKLTIIIWPVLGRQNIQAKEVFQKPPSSLY